MKEIKIEGWSLYGGGGDGGDGGDNEGSGDNGGSGDGGGCGCGGVVKSSDMTGVCLHNRRSTKHNWAVLRRFLPKCFEFQKPKIFELKSQLKNCLPKLMNLQNLAKLQR